MLLLLRFFQNPKKRDFLRFFALLHTFSRTMTAGQRFLLIKNVGKIKNVKKRVFLF